MLEINVNELRVGSIVGIANYMDFKAVKVTEIRRERILVEGSVGVYSSKNHKIIPIELTKELVLKSNIKADFRTCYRGDFSNVKIGGQRMYYFCDTNTVEFSDNNHILKYVHELQNLYFALTGSELVFSTEP